MPPLANPKHEAFAQRVAKDGNATKAYQSVYTSARHAAETSASRLLKNAKVIARLTELQKAVASNSILTLSKKRSLLEKFATSPKLKPADRMRAIELDAKLAGEMREDIVRHTGTINVEQRHIIVNIPIQIAAPRQLKEIGHGKQA